MTDTYSREHILQLLLLLTSWEVLLLLLLLLSEHDVFVVLSLIFIFLCRTMYGNVSSLITMVRLIRGEIFLLVISVFIILKLLWRIIPLMIVFFEIMLSFSSSSMSG